jgi:hypothetical protein
MLSIFLKYSPIKSTNNKAINSSEYWDAPKFEMFNFIDQFKGD